MNCGVIVTSTGFSYDCERYTLSTAAYCVYSPLATAVALSHSTTTLGGSGSMQSTFAVM